MSAFDELYQEIIMDHYRSPRGTARLDHIPQAMVHENPTCGDSIKLEVVVGDDGSCERVRFDGKGCAISTASASLMTEPVQGLSVAEARERAELFISALRGEDPVDGPGRDGRSRGFQGPRELPRPGQVRDTRLARSSGFTAGLLRRQ